MYNKTLIAAKRQIFAFRCRNIEIGILNRRLGKMLLKRITLRDIDKYIPLLKHHNRQGCDVFVRPYGEINQGIILVDDLQLSQLAQLTKAGLKPACIVETSEMNFQVWIRICYHTLPPSTATQIAKTLANQYNGDPNSADWRHFGRLAGFTNRKPKHIGKDGQYPYVLLHSYTGALAKNGYKILQQVQQKQKKLTVPIMTFQSNHSVCANSYYQDEYEKLNKRYGSNIDYSRADWIIAKKMIVRNYSEQQILHALLNNSPHLSERKKGHIIDYVKRTVSRACRN